MEFTKDINFNCKPISGTPLTITYTGFLSKSNTVYIVYGYGENWENTTEQLMKKDGDSFSVNVKLSNYNTFNFCFRNSENIWDNNNSFNYITTIEENSIAKTTKLSTEQANHDCNQIIDEIVNNIELENSIENDSDLVIETQDNPQILDELFEDLLIEYSNIKTTDKDIEKNQIENFNTNKIQEANISSDNNNYENIDNNYEQELEALLASLYEDIDSNKCSVFDNTEIVEVTQDSNYENIDVNYEQELEALLTSLYEDIASNKSNVFDNNEITEVTQDSNTDYIQETVVSSENNNFENINDTQEIDQLLDNLYNEFVSREYDNFDLEEFNKAFNSISREIKTFSNREMVEDSNVNYVQNLENNDIENVNNTQEFEKLLDNIFGAYSDLNTTLQTSTQTVDIGVEISKAFENDFIEISEPEDLSNFTEIATFAQELNEKENNLTENYFNYENLDFSYENQKFENINYDKELDTEFFSDSFYDDYSETTESYSKIQSIVDDVTTSLNNETNDLSSTYDESATSNQEYIDYFDNLLDEIITSSSSALSTPVTKEEVSKKENDILGVETQQLKDIEAVPNQYALYDYKSYSFIYMIKRRFKIIFNTLFAKIPTLFSTNNENENN